MSDDKLVQLLFKFLGLSLLFSLLGGLFVVAIYLAIGWGLLELLQSYGMLP